MWLYTRLWGLGRMFDCLFSACTFLKSGDKPAHAISILYARISPQWFSELRWLWLNVPWQVAHELNYRQVPTLCLDSSIVSPLRLHWVKGVCMFKCNLPPALLAEWPRSFTCHCGNTGMERTLNKSQHTKLTLEKKILPLLLPGFELATFQSWVQRSYQQAIPDVGQDR